MVVIVVVVVVVVGVVVIVVVVVVVVIVVAVIVVAVVVVVVVLVVVVIVIPCASEKEIRIPVCLFIFLTRRKRHEFRKFVITCTEFLRQLRFRDRNRVIFQRNQSVQIRIRRQIEQFGGRPIVEFQRDADDPRLIFFAENSVRNRFDRINSIESMLNRVHTKIFTQGFKIFWTDLRIPKQIRDFSTKKSFGIHQICESRLKIRIL